MCSDHVFPESVFLPFVFLLLVVLQLPGLFFPFARMGGEKQSLGPVWWVNVFLLLGRVGRVFVYSLDLSNLSIVRIEDWIKSKLAKHMCICRDKAVRRGQAFRGASSSRHYYADRSIGGGSAIHSSPVSYSTCSHINIELFCGYIG